MQSCSFVLSAGKKRGKKCRVGEFCCYHVGFELNSLSFISDEWICESWKCPPFSHSTNFTHDPRLSTLGWLTTTASMKFYIRFAIADPGILELSTSVKKNCIREKLDLMENSICLILHACFLSERASTTAKFLVSFEHDINHISRRWNQRWVEI